MNRYEQRVREREQERHARQVERQVINTMDRQGVLNAAEEAYNSVYGVKGVFEYSRGWYIVKSAKGTPMGRWREVALLDRIREWQATAYDRENPAPDD